MPAIVRLVHIWHHGPHAPTHPRSFRHIRAARSGLPSDPPWAGLPSLTLAAGPSGSHPCHRDNRVRKQNIDAPTSTCVPSERCGSLAGARACLWRSRLRLRLRLELELELLLELRELLYLQPTTHVLTQLRQSAAASDSFPRQSPFRVLHTPRVSECDLVQRVS